ncbi:DUF1206 domain-containing protein [Salimicrobium halophilum]|uniref:DUF1206 domain-containing protein n=1 Tax=Salimicrobium halophilum TaxID=86666 RepID=A0A1G8T5F0_9BACI|nr:DUF1206 domain-containing protein [Salimicrobium halophilum]SDJ36736.1 protein of unknown function [Salimicrobium halophilum]
MGMSIHTDDRVKEEIKPWVRRLARTGYMAKGFVYMVVGILSLLAALGFGGKTTGTSGMFQSLALMPLGNILVWLTGIGLFMYILWVLIKAINDPKGEGKSPGALIKRFAYLINAAIYGTLAVQAIRIALNAATGSSGNSNQTLSARLLEQPFGPWIVGGLGAIVIGYGVVELITGITRNFMKKFILGDMDDHEKKIAKNSGTIGLTARGIVLGLIGFFFIQTAITHDPDQAKGLDGALSEIASQPFGRWLLGFVALGLVLYGVYQITRGRYEHMQFGKKEREKS